MQWQAPGSPDTGSGCIHVSTTTCLPVSRPWEGLSKQEGMGQVKDARQEAQKDPGALSEGQVREPGQIKRDFGSTGCRM